MQGKNLKHIGLFGGNNEWDGSHDTPVAWGYYWNVLFLISSTTERVCPTVFEDMLSLSLLSLSLSLSQVLLYIYIAQSR